MEDPLSDHERAARLSVAIHKVCSATGWVVANTSLWAIMAVSLRSEIEMVPRGLLVDTSACWMGDAKG